MERRACPACAEPMERRTLARRPEGMIDLDLCWGCHAIWFDRNESVQLAPRAVMELFQAIDKHRDRPGRPVQSARCPQCRTSLKLTHDMLKSNRISYLRCEHGHGRLTTFYQFLREKEFVRSLTRVEVEKLRVHVQQVRCSSCGGAVNLEREMQCPYCTAPLSVLDADAVKKALVELEVQDRRLHAASDPAAIADALAMADAVIAKHRAKPVDLVSETLRVLLTRI